MPLGSLIFTAPGRIIGLASLQCVPGGIAGDPIFPNTSAAFATETTRAWWCRLRGMPFCQKM